MPRAHHTKQVSPCVTPIHDNVLSSPEKVLIGRRAVAHTSVCALTRPLRVGYIRYMLAMPSCVRYIRYTYVRYV